MFCVSNVSTIHIDVGFRKSPLLYFSQCFFLVLSSSRDPVVDAGVELTSSSRGEFNVFLQCVYMATKRRTCLCVCYDRWDFPWHERIRGLLQYELLAKDRDIAAVVAGVPTGRYSITRYILDYHGANVRDSYLLLLYIRTT